MQNSDLYFCVIQTCGFIIGSIVMDSGPFPPDGLFYTILSTFCSFLSVKPNGALVLISLLLVIVYD